MHDEELSRALFTLAMCLIDSNNLIVENILTETEDSVTISKENLAEVSENLYWVVNTILSSLNMKEEEIDEE